MSVGVANDYFVVLGFTTCGGSQNLKVRTNMLAIETYNRYYVEIRVYEVMGNILNFIQMKCFYLGNTTNGLQHTCMFLFLIISQLQP